MRIAIFLRCRGVVRWAPLMATAIALICGCAILPGHWRPGWNQAWPPGTPVPGTAGFWKLTNRETTDGRFLGLAISGGGSRAANFGAAVMLELQRRGLLEQVDVISGVSGGTLPAVYYGLGDKAGAFTEPAVRDALGYDFQSSWLRRWFLPQNVLRYWLSDFTRSDIMVQIFNKRLYHQATFADLRPYPKILLNATVHNDHTRFTFTDDRFGQLHSVLAKYQVANAVNASSAFPGAFDDVTLQWYSDPPQYLHGCLVLVVDATPSSERAELAAQQSSRKWIDYFINTNALDAMDAMLLESRRSVLALLGIPMVEQDQDIQGRLPVNDRNQCGCDVRHIALRHLGYSADLPGDPDFARRVTKISTKFWISREEQADLFQAAGLIMRELEEQHLLPDRSFRTRCAKPA
jgi:hypothetical protein